MSTQTREYPQFPIPAVAAIILEQEHVLLVRRGQAPALGKWALPGGVIELGESPQDALEREIREECRIDIVVEGLVDVIHTLVKDTDGRIQYQYLILEFLASCQVRTDGWHVPLEAGTDVTDARWVALDDLGSFDLIDGLTNVVDKAVAMNEDLEKKCVFSFANISDSIGNKNPLLGGAGVGKTVFPILSIVESHIIEKKGRNYEQNL